MDKTEPPPRCDVSSVDFPTDAIRIGDMRRREPHLFRSDGYLRGETQALATRAWEHRLAEKAFAMALGLPDPHPNWDARWMRRLIADGYLSLELASGARTAMELARGLEGLARSQAMRLRGQGR